MGQQITKRLDVETGHRLMRHEGKCRNYHGHHFLFDVTVEADELDEVGRVVDFSVIKQKVGGWLDEHIDHGMVLQNGDPLGRILSDGGFKVFFMDGPPTSENLARLVFEHASVLLTKPLRVVRVTCWETPSCSAVYP